MFRLGCQKIPGKILLTNNIIHYIILKKKQYYTPARAVKGADGMVFNTGAALLDAIVLAAVSKETQGTYGYRITQEVRAALEVSESTLYPVLRRLQKDGCLEVYDQEYGGRNRRYYKITEQGRVQLNLYMAEWKEYSSRITKIFTGGHVE